MADAVVVATGLALVASTGLGVAVSVGGVHLGRHRWLHHALYGAAVVACMLTVAVGILTRTPLRWAMVVVLVPLAVLTRTRGGTTRHVLLAAAALLLYAAVVTAFAAS
jgi:hypothetical protein